MDTTASAKIIHTVSNREIYSTKTLLTASYLRNLSPTKLKSVADLEMFEGGFTVYVQ